MATRAYRDEQGHPVCQPVFQKELRSIETKKNVQKLISQASEKFYGLIGKNEDCVGSIGGIICGVQLIPLIGSILLTEIALKKNFDKNGTRR